MECKHHSESEECVVPCWFMAQNNTLPSGDLISEQYKVEGNLKKLRISQ